MAKYKTYHIVFMRKTDEEEKSTIKEDYFFDSTEFDVEGETIEEIFPALYNLFADFCDENKFMDVSVNEIYEVPYDGEEDQVDE